MCKYNTNVNVSYFLHELAIAIARFFSPYIAATVSFSQSTYSVGENNGVLQPMLTLSNPSSTDITVEVLSSDESAIGK